MKGNICIIILCMLFVEGCKAQHATNKFRQQMQEPYLYAFKINYFKKLLIEGFNNSDAIKKILAADHSGYGEHILPIQDYELIDSLAKVDNKIMAQDSLNRINRVSEGAQGKHVFDYALTKYQSKWLDSLAKERYRMYAKQLNNNAYD